MTIATEFTPWASLAGGMLIGSAAVLLMALVGRVAGVSGIAVRLLPPYGDKAFAGRAAFVAGLVAAPMLYRLAGGEFIQHVPQDGLLLVIAGLLAGFGSVWGGGCTSGHGICGMSRLSLRSAAATVIFMAVAMATVFLMRHAGG